MEYTIFFWFTLAMVGVLLDKYGYKQGIEQMIDALKGIEEPEAQWTNYREWSFGLKLCSAGVVGFIITLIVISINNS